MTSKPHQQWHQSKYPCQWFISVPHGHFGCCHYCFLITIYINFIFFLKKKYILYIICFYLVFNYFVLFVKWTHNKTTIRNFLFFWELIRNLLPLDYNVYIFNIIYFVHVDNVSFCVRVSSIAIFYSNFLY